MKYRSPLVSPGFTKQIMSTLFSLGYYDSFVTRTAVRLNGAKFKPLIFSASSFTLSYVANRFILIILYDLCLLSA
jgi:hypothetical protein